jgi:hypothetical protein
MGLKTIDSQCNPMRKLRPAGFEPATLGLGNGSRSDVSLVRQGDSDPPELMVAPPVAQLLAKPSEVGADLARVIEAWPRLPESMREAILKLID